MKKISLTQGQFTIVDDEDFEELNQYNWFAYKKRTLITQVETCLE